MTDDRELPSPELLAKLALRGIVAYAYRAAMRIVVSQDGPFAEECLRSLTFVKDFVTSKRALSSIESVNEAALLCLGVMKEEEKMRAIDPPFGSAVRGTGSVTRYAVMCYASAAMSWPGQGQVSFGRCCRRAFRAANWLAGAQRGRAVEDYRILQSLFHSSGTIEIGRPFNPGDDGPLGELLVASS